MADVPEVRNGEGWVVMTHPKLKDKDGNPAYAEVTQEALDVVWSEKGWVAAGSSRSSATAKVGG